MSIYYNVDPLFNFRIVRYEDMTDQVVQTTKDIFSFLNLPIQPETYKFLKEHCDPSVWKKAHVVPQVNMFLFVSVLESK